MKYERVFVMSSLPLPVNKVPASLGFVAGVCEYVNVEYTVFDTNLFVHKRLTNDEWQQVYQYCATNRHFTDEFLYSELCSKLNGILYEAVTQFDGFDLIAMTVFSEYQMAITRLLLSKIRQHTEIPIIVGGPGIAINTDANITFGKELLNDNLVDYYVLGEGDLVLQEFLAGNIELGVNAKGLPETFVPQINELNGLPFPMYKDLVMPDYASGSAHNNAIVNITGSRGCVRKCTFCNVANIWSKYRYRSGEDIAAEILHHYNTTGVKNFFFTDSLVNGSMSNFKALMEALVLLKETHPELKELTWVGQFIIRAQQSHPESLYDLMARSGCDYIQPGIESGSEAVRFHMGKKFLNADIDYHFEMCQKYKLKNNLLMIINYPSETLDDFNTTLDQVGRWSKYLADHTIIGITVHPILEIVKDAPLYRKRNEFGIRVLREDKGDITTLNNWMVNSNPGLTLNERHRRYKEILTKIGELGYPQHTAISHDVALESLASIIRNLGQTDAQ
jgi:anaerobic magnesium-protoporphyrin IX monomethyl ester cyclase